MKAISFIKKHAMVVLAGAAIVGFSSFKAVEKYLQTSYYWFEYDSSGTVLQNQSSTPAQSALPPSHCDDGTINCAKAFTSYNMVSPGVYAPGTPAQDENNEDIIVKRNQN